MASGCVLVIDDDPVIVDLLRVSLEIEGYRTVSAGDGASGIERARSERPDLVVLDVMMPAMDGLETARRLRQDPETASIPVLLLSAKAQSDDVAAGQQVADDYVTKPFDPVELLDRVAALIDRAQG